MVDGRREKRGGGKEEKSEPKREAERYLAAATRAGQIADSFS